MTAKTATRYFLAEQLHFIGRDEHQTEVVITIQSWKSRSGQKGIYVKTHNGVEATRRFYDTEHGATLVQRNFALARAMIESEELVPLSEQGATDEVVRRGGPNPGYCNVGQCGAQIPYAAGQCAEGHPLTQLPTPGSYVFGSNRRPVFTVIPGGKSRTGTAGPEQGPGLFAVPTEG